MATLPRLLAAAKEGNCVALAELLKALSDPDRPQFSINLEGTDGFNALHHAITSRHAGAVQLLLDHGAGVEMDDNKVHRRPLYLAIEACVGIHIVRMLLDAGADVNAKNGEKFGIGSVRSGFTTALHAAVVVHRDDVPAGAGGPSDELLSSRHPSSLPPPQQAPCTSTPAAALLANEEEEEQRLAILRLLIDRGANVNASDGHDNTVLHAAVGAHNVEAVKFLLEKTSINVMHKNKFNRSALIEAVDRENRAELRIVEALLEHGANPDDDQSSSSPPASSSPAISPATPTTPLHCAVSKGDLNCVVALLKHGADPTRQIFGGETPLHLASSSDVVNALFDFSTVPINADVRDQLGCTPMHRAVDRNLRRGFAGGIAAYSPPNGGGNSELLILYLRRGADITCETNAGNTLLTLFTNVVDFKFALNLGASPDLKQPGGWSPIHLATFGILKCEIANTLLDAGVNVFVGSERGAAPWRFKVGTSAYSLTLYPEQELEFQIRLLQYAHTTSACKFVL